MRWRCQGLSLSQQICIGWVWPILLFVITMGGRLDYCPLFFFSFFFFGWGGVRQSLISNFEDCSNLFAWIIPIICTDYSFHSWKLTLFWKAFPCFMSKVHINCVLLESLCFWFSLFSFSYLKFWVSTLLIECYWMLLAVVLG